MQEDLCKLGEAMKSELDRCNANTQELEKRLQASMDAERNKNTLLYIANQDKAKLCEVQEVQPFYRTHAVDGRVVLD